MQVGTHIIIKLLAVNRLLMKQQYILLDDSAMLIFEIWLSSDNGDMLTIGIWFAKAASKKKIKIRVFHLFIC